jgi:hypothetical protein
MDDACLVECPYCGTTGKTKTRPKPGTKIRCPSCQAEFTQQGPVFAATEKGERRYLRYAALALLALVGAILVTYLAIAGAEYAKTTPEKFAVGMLGMVAIPAIVLGVLLVFPLTGAYVANQKGRSTTEGAVFGFLFGPFGILIVLLLPTIEPAGAGSKR